MTYLTDQTSAIEAATSRDRRHSLSTERYEGLRRFLLADSFAFTAVVCGHLDLVPAFHAPLSYAFCHLTDQLIRTLDDPDFDSFVTREFRNEFQRRGVEWWTPDGREAVDELLDTLNIRLYRGSFKSSVGTHGGGAFIGTKDPNRTIWLVSNSDPNAYAFCDQIGKTVRSGVYADLFPERIPQGNLNELITQSRITLGGRTISHPQTNIEADGYLTKRISAHFDTFIIDDLIVRENASPAMIEPARKFILGLAPFEMVTRRVWRRHEGTIWAQNDDHQLLTSASMANECLSIFIPIEVYENGYVENISERGTPTNAALHPTEKIQKLFNKTMADPEKGAAEWRCNYLLDASGNSGDAPFPPSVVDDPMRRHKRADHPKHAGRFIVGRYLRDCEGRVLTPTGEQWQEGDQRGVLWFDPWRDLYRVMSIDAAWKDGGDNWSVEVEGFDPEMVRFQLANLSDSTGVDGWVEAACALDEVFNVQAIGFDAGAYQDVVIRQMMATDKRLRRIRHKMRPVPTHGVSKSSRIRNYTAEPLKMYRLLLDPTEDGIPTRDEMKLYRANDKNAKDGIIDSIAMCPAVAQRRKSSEDREAARAAGRTRRNQTDPTLGVPLVA